MALITSDKQTKDYKNKIADVFIRLTFIMKKKIYFN